MSKEPTSRSVASRIQDSLDAKAALLRDTILLDEVVRVVNLIADRMLAGNKALFFGNGGSSMDAGHLAAELMGRFYVDRRPLPAVSLADATAALTAIGNDYGYEHTFVRQLQGLGIPGDVAIGLTTSGNSPNVVDALKFARTHGIHTVVFTGSSGGAVAAIAEHVLRMPTTDTPRIQECQLLLGHTICELVESAVLASEAQ